MKALIVGAGIGGMSAGIALARNSVDVEMIDIDPLWRVYGAGITLTGATLRAFKALGIYEAVRRDGYVGEGIRVCSGPASRSPVIHAVPEARRRRAPVRHHRAPGRASHTPRATRG